MVGCVTDKEHSSVLNDEILRPLTHNTSRCRRSSRGDRVTEEAGHGLGGEVVTEGSCSGAAPATG